MGLNPTEGQSIVELRGEEGDGDATQHEEVLPGETGVGEGNVVISPDVEPQDGKPNPATDQCLMKEVRQHPGGEVAGTRAPDKQDILQADPADLREWQKEDPSLERARELTSENPVEKSGDRVHFVYLDRLLYRLWRPTGTDQGDVRSCEQLVLPQKCRKVVLRLANNIPLAGHLGIRKTRARVLQRYYWPGVFTDIAKYCRTCEVCQRSQPRRPTKVKMITMPIVVKPFQQIAMDFVGPLPRTQRGNRFILTMCDYATRYPEAIPLPSTEAGRVAKELVSVFARVGVPDEILMDQGSNFMSALLGEVYLLLNIQRIRTTPYHPQTDGLVERDTQGHVKEVCELQPEGLG